MAFTSTIEGKTLSSNKRIHYGTYTSSGGGSGGNINTGLTRVDVLQLQPKGSGTVSDGPAVNETMPLSSGSVTIVTATDEVGTWVAIGK